MGTKNNPSKFDCYANARPNEPMFVLLGRDRHAPSLVRLWALLRERAGENPEIVEEARECADAMHVYVQGEGKEPIDVVHELLNKPELKNFALGLQLEAVHQRERWGADHDAGKAPEDWFWLIGWLAGCAERRRRRQGAAPLHNGSGRAGQLARGDRRRRHSHAARHRAAGADRRRWWTMIRWLLCVFWFGHDWPEDKPGVYDLKCRRCRAPARY